MLRTTRKPGAFERLMASVLTIAVAGYSIPAGVLAATQPSGAAEIRGMILLPDGLTPITGVTVKAANLETKQIYSSEKTDKDGIYKLSSLPAGSYDLAVQTSEGLYASDTLVNAVAGKRQIVSLAIRAGVEAQDEPPKPPDDPNAPEGEKKEEPKKEEPKKEEPKKEEPKPEPEPDQTKGKPKGKSFWRSPLGAGIIIVGGAVVVGFAADAIVGDDDELGDDGKSMSGTKRSH